MKVRASLDRLRWAPIESWEDYRARKDRQISARVSSYAAELGLHRPQAVNDAEEPRRTLVPAAKRRKRPQAPAESRRTAEWRAYYRAYYARRKAAAVGLVNTHISQRYGNGRE